MRQSIITRFTTKVVATCHLVWQQSHVVLLRLLAQFSLNNVHKRGLKYHHFISFPPGTVDLTSSRMAARFLVAGFLVAGLPVAGLPVVVFMVAGLPVAAGLPVVIFLVAGLPVVVFLVAGLPVAGVPVVVFLVAASGAGDPV